MKNTSKALIYSYVWIGVALLFWLINDSDVAFYTAIVNSTVWAATDYLEART